MIRALRTGLVLLLVAVPVAEAHAATWGPSQRVSAPGERVVASAIAANAPGQAVVAYSVDSSLPQAVHVRRRARGGRLGATQVLRASPFWTASSPAVAIDARGRAVVAWAESLRSPTGVATRIAAARAAPGRPFDRPVVVATAGADPPSGVRTAIVPAGAVVAWTTNASTGAAVERPGGGWSAQSFGDDATGELLSLAARRDGGVEAAWSGLERGTVVPAVSLARLSPGRIVARWRPDRGRFAAAVRLSRPGWVAVMPSAAVTALGAGAVAWQEARYDDLSRRTRLSVAMLRPGRGWTSPTAMARARAPQLVPVGERLLLTRLRPRSVLELVEGRP